MNYDQELEGFKTPRHLSIIELFLVRGPRATSISNILSTILHPTARSNPGVA